MLNQENCTQCFVSICTYILIIFQYKITSVIKLSSVDKPKNLVRFLEKQDC